MASAPIQIGKGVPLTPASRLPSRERKYPFPEMKVGDSFVVRLADTRSDTLAKLSNALYASAKLAIGRGKITMRRLPDGDGFRVWRIA